MKLLFLLCVVTILLHTTVKFENRIIHIDVDFNRVVGKIKKLVEKL